MRQYGNELLFGGFESDANVVIREDWTRNGMPPGAWLSPFPTSLPDARVTPDFSRIREPYEKACELLPCLKGANVAARASAFLMTPDGYPLVGPIDDTQNYWLQGACTHRDSYPGR